MSSRPSTLISRSTDPPRPAATVEPKRTYTPLFRRVAVANALLLGATVVVTTVVLAPEKFSSFAIDEASVLVAALALVAFVNLYLLRRFIRPVQALTALARRVDLADLGERMPGAAPTSEAGELAMAFNEMLGRLEAERQESTGRVLAGQEAERLRIARELHDQIAQELIALLLLLSRLQARAPEEVGLDVAAVREGLRASLEDLRRIAVDLRPEALDDLGLTSALAVLGQRVAERSSLQVSERIDPRLPQLPPETELVIYRVAQEALTNVARHSGSDQAELRLHAGDGRLVLTVLDHGTGLPATHVPGAGIRGMRERATLIGARLTIANKSAGDGCEVRLEVPLEDGR